MTPMMLQAGIAVFGLAAILLVYASNPRWARWAPIFGLLSQPFWIASAWHAEQWAIIGLAVFYVYGWCKGIKKHWLDFPVVEHALHGRQFLK